MSCPQVLYGGYVRGQKSSKDPKGNRNFVVYTLVGDERIPLYKNNDEDLREMIVFRGKSPKEVAKKVVTEICQMIKKSDPKDFKNFCRAVKNSDLKKREHEIMKIENVAKVDPNRAESMVNWDMYPGFQFELRDIMNTTSDGKPRNYIYYGERIELDKPKKYKGKKFMYESQVIPIRKDYTLVQALIDHHYKSEKAIKRYSKTQNFKKYRSSRKKSRKTSSKKKRSNSKTKKTSSRRKSKTHRTIMNYSPKEIRQKCSPGYKSFKITELNEILQSLNLSTRGAKPDKCKRILAYYEKNNPKAD